MNRSGLGTLILMIVLISSLTSRSGIAAAVFVPSIPTEGGAWTTPDITVSITPQLDRPWYRDSYAFDVNRAIVRWAQSIIAYTDRYGSNYIRKLSFTICVSGVNASLCGTPDIEIQFVQAFSPQSGGLGVTSFPAPRSGTFSAPTTTTLAAYDPTNTTQLSDVDMINIASHEFGHALGLNHATASGTDDGTFELMFLSYGQPVGNLADSLEAPSTLDLYALSYVYSWLATSPTLSGPGHDVTEISLPSGTAYSSVYPYPEQVQTLQDSANRSRLEALVLGTIVVLLLTLVFALGILLARKRPPPASQVLTWPATGPPPTT